MRVSSQPSHLSLEIRPVVRSNLYILDDQIVIMTQKAYEANALNEEFGQNWVLATVRLRDFKQTQTASMVLFRKFKRDKYMYWYIMSLILQVEEEDPNSMVLLTLGEKMMDKSISQGKLQNFEGNQED